MGISKVLSDMVHWVIDRALGRSDPLMRGGEAAYEELIEALERSETPYTLVRKIPFTDMLIDPDDTSKTPAEVRLEIEGPVFVTGTTSMGGVSIKHGWTPGYITAPGQDELITHWGNEVLNADAVIGKLRDIVPPCEEFFARPVLDSKSFSGMTSLRDDFIQWRDTIVAGGNDFVTLSGDDLVMLAPLKKIYAEYRLYVIDGTIVTGSRYKLGSRVFYTRDLDPAMLDYARARIAEYCPRQALCLDIAHIAGDEPYKVIETNSISSAGFYACDMNVFVNAINAVFGDD